MPTKPTVTFTLATNVNYAAGPFIGSATKAAPPVADGYIPGVIIDAEHHNFIGNAAGQWITSWLFLGTSAADEDAHLVETDATGLTNLAGSTFGGTTAAFAPITVTTNSGATGSCITSTNNAGGFALLATCNGVSAAVRGVSTGIKPGLEGVNTAGGGPGVTGAGNGVGNGVEGTGGATGQGGTFLGGATSGHGVEGTAVGPQSGVSGLSSSTIAGSFGVQGVAMRSDCAGVVGLNGTSGADPVNAAHSAVVGFGEDGVGVWGQSTKGYGVWAQGDTTTPTRAALHVDPQDTNPLSNLQGDIIVNSTKDTVEVRKSAAFNVFHESPHGFAFEHAISSSGSRNSAAFATQATATFAVPDAPKEAGTVIVKVTLSVRNTSSNLNTIEVRIRDVTAGATIVTEEIFLAQTNAAVTVAGARANAFERTIAITDQYTLPAAGARIFDVQIATHGVATGVDYSQLLVTVEGVY